MFRDLVERTSCDPLSGFFGGASDSVGEALRSATVERAPDLHTMYDVRNHYGRFIGGIVVEQQGTWAALAPGDHDVCHLKTPEEAIALTIALHLGAWSEPDFQTGMVALKAAAPLL